MPYQRGFAEKRVCDPGVCAQLIRCAPASLILNECVRERKHREEKKCTFKEQA